MNEITNTIESAKYVVVGNVDAGKSSFVGVMEKNVLDDGNGFARSLITKYKHELDSGRTSSHSPHYIVKNGEVTTLIDLCGHEKYLKTTVFGVTGLFADYGIIMIGANMGLTGMAKEHLALLISNRLPFMIIITKVDLCPENILANLKKEIARIIKRSHKQVIYFDEEETEINGSYIKESHSSIIETFQKSDSSIVPVISISNKTGFNVNFTRELITSIKSKSYLVKKGLLPETNQNDLNPNNYPMVMYIDTTYSVAGIGIVLSGTVKYKPLHLGQKVFIGPINNKFISITIKTMKNCIRENISVINPEDTGTVGIRLDVKGSFNREMFSKGQIITDDYEFAMKNMCYHFNCDVAIFNHPTTIRNGYETVVHCRTIRQSGKFALNDDVVLRSNSKQNIDIKFMQHPEFILPGTLFTFRDGRTKGIGKIIYGTPFCKKDSQPQPPMKPEENNDPNKKEPNVSIV